MQKRERERAREGGREGRTGDGGRGGGGGGGEVAFPVLREPWNLLKHL